MAGISTYLSKIKSAVYGEEVRGSIHDAIAAMNEESSNAVSYAKTAKDSAAASASAAKVSETNAANTANTITASVNVAKTAAANASSSANLATQKASAAATSASNAANSASTATQKASAAASSATAAKTSETNAANSASTATQKASNAAASATSAKNAESNAVASASAAEAAKNAVTQNAAAAKTSETNAAAYATAANQSASTAATSASNAANSASTATQKASAAASSASAAKTSEANAAASATSAKQYSGKPPKPQNGSWWIWDAEKATYVDSKIGCELVGPPGVGVKDIQLTSGNHAPGSTDIYTLSLTDGTTKSISVYNGRNGTGAGDVLGISFDLVIPASAWVNGEVTISDERLLASAAHKYLLSVSEACRDTFLNCDVRANDITTNGRIIFTSQSKPTSDLTVNLIRLELGVSVS